MALSPARPIQLRWDAFKAWNTAHRNVIVGYVGDPCHCPLADWVLSLTSPAEVHVLSAVTIRTAGGHSVDYDIDFCVGDVVDAIDSLKPEGAPLTGYDVERAIAQVEELWASWDGCEHNADF